MTQDDGTKVHYLCQTYAGGGGSLKVDKLFTYTTAEDAQGRAEREFREIGRHLSGPPVRAHRRWGGA